MSSRSYSRLFHDTIAALIALAAVILTLVIGFTASWLAGIVTGAFVLILDITWGARLEQADGQEDDEETAALGDTQPEVSPHRHGIGRSFDFSAAASTEPVPHADGDCTECGPHADLQILARGSVLDAGIEPSPSCPCVEAQRRGGGQLVGGYGLQAQRPDRGALLRTVPCTACAIEIERHRAGIEEEGQGGAGGTDETTWW